MVYILTTTEVCDPTGRSKRGVSKAARGGNCENGTEEDLTTEVDSPDWQSQYRLIQNMFLPALKKNNDL